MTSTPLQSVEPNGSSTTGQLRRWHRWTLAGIAVGLGALWFDAHYSVGLNATASLPGHLFLIERGATPRRGELVAFRWPGGGPYPAGATFVKVLAGVPGDIVTASDGEYFVNCVPVGRPKAASRQGQRLDPGPIGPLPPGRYYVRAPHPDSLDSRYALTGWVTASQIIGRAYAVF